MKSGVLRVLNLICLLGILTMVALAASNKNQALTGVVSDTMCGAKHMMPNGDVECTRECVKGGAKYALVVGDKVYALSGHEADLDKLAGQKVTVNGDVKGDKVQVASVAPAK